MSSHPATGATVTVIDSGYSVPQGHQVDLQNRFVRMAARWALQNTMPLAVTLEQYLLNIPPLTSWLPSVERRIGDSTLPDEYQSFWSTEWLREEVGQAAIRFFENTADLLPGEPFIYASQTGALVAEFDAPRGTLTTIISPSAVILFAVKADDRDNPIEMTLKQGSNRLREDLKEVVQPLSG